MRRIHAGVSLVALGLWGCGFDSPPSLTYVSPTDSFVDSGTVLRPPPSLPSLPSDTRPVVTAARAPVPISGGTLLITGDGLTAVAADPDRDRVSIVGLSDGTVRTVILQPGDEPGRVVEDGAHRVHVALRRGGALVTIDVATGKVVARRAVCGAPRGVAYQATTDVVHVACAGGELVTFPASGGDATRRLNLDVDLRDVVVQSSGTLAVSRFKTAQLLFVDANGAILSRASLAPMNRVSDLGNTDPVEPAVAWRALGVNDTVFLLHQYDVASTIALKPTATAPSVDGGFGPTPLTPAGESPYGAPPGGCGGLVQAAISRVTAGNGPTMGMPLATHVLTVDAALSADAKWALLAHAGLVDSPADGLNLPKSGPGGAITLLETSAAFQNGNGPVDGSCARPQSIQVGGQSTAVAFNPSSSPESQATQTWFAVQTREPATLVTFRDAAGTAPRTILLGGDSVLDTGHELFHRDAGGGIACASCHPEGGEDGRVWKFDTVGPRRTQAVHVGLEGTEPFHWDGDMTNLGTLVDEVMVHRMGGAPQSADRKNALAHWLFQLAPPAAIVSTDDPRAARGKALFESTGVGCSGCHSGAKLTSNQNVFVGTTASGVTLQVPSLHGVGYRAPFIHDGCAVTLRDRFNPSCGGGDLHGKTSALSEGQIGDLIAYLQSL